MRYFWRTLVSRPARKFPLLPSCEPDFRGTAFYKTSEMYQTGAEIAGSHFLSLMSDSMVPLFWLYVLSFTVMPFRQRKEVVILAYFACDLAERSRWYDLEKKFRIATYPKHSFPSQARKIVQCELRSLPQHRLQEWEPRCVTVREKRQYES